MKTTAPLPFTLRATPTTFKVRGVVSSRSSPKFLSPLAQDAEERERWIKAMETTISRLKQPLQVKNVTVIINSY